MKRHSLFAVSSLALVCGSSFVSTSLVATEACAYVPPGAYLIAKLAEKRAALSVNDLDVQLETVYAARGDDELSERLQLKRGNKVRWVRSEGEADTVIIWRDGKRTEVSPTGEVKQAEQPVEPLAQLLYPKTTNLETARGDLIAWVQKLGVDLSIDTLQRAGSRVAYVFGAKAGEVEKPQIWLDKETLLPMRLIYKEGDKTWDLSFAEWGVQGGTDVFPRLIKRTLNGQPFSDSTVEKVAVNTKLADSLFNPPSQKK